MATRMIFNLKPDVEAIVLRRGGDVDGDMRRRAERVQAAAKRNAPEATGELRRSIVVRQSRGEGGRFESGWDVVADVPYAIYVHEGRRAGAKMPPSAPIARWMRRKGIPAEAEFPIRRKIGRDGIEPKPFLRDAIDEAG